MNSVHTDVEVSGSLPIAYPERRMVSRETLTLWASDAVANGDTSIEATDDELRADINLVRAVLDDSGYATIVGAL